MHGVFVCMFPALMIAQPTEIMVYRSLQLVNSAIDGFVNGFRFIDNGNRLAIFKAHFHHTSFVMSSGFFAVFIADMDFDAGYMFRKVFQGTFHHCLRVPDQLFMTVDIMICIDLNYHNLSFFVKYANIDKHGAIFFIIEIGSDHQARHSAFYHQGVYETCSNSLLSSQSSISPMPVTYMHIVMRTEDSECTQHP
jgi:hypothetical protein